MPEATLFPITFCANFYLRIRKLGVEEIRLDKQEKGLSNTTPANSQCPVVVSFPGDFSAIFPKDPIGLDCFFIPSIGCILPKPNFSRLGSSNPPHFFGYIC